MSRASEISDAAAEWLVRLEGQASPELWDTFEKWMDHDPRHRAAFVRLRVAWNRVDRLKYLRPADGTVDADLLAWTKISPVDVMAGDLPPKEDRPRSRFEDLLLPDRRRVLATAAAIAVTGVLAWFGAYHLGWKPAETAVGGRETIELSDGSTIDLNTDTELNSRISGTRREIMLARGEALFHVAHDARRPFYVMAAGTVVRAVGTEFSVRIRDREHVDILVAEGKVAVGAPGTEANFENPSLLARAPKISAGEAASVRPESPVLVYPMPQERLARKLAWTTGYLDFQGETLDEAVQEFNRYHDRHITIADPSIVKKQFGGRFRTGDLKSFLEVLQHSFGIRVQVPDNESDIRLLGGAEASIRR